MTSRAEGLLPRDRSLLWRSLLYVVVIYFASRLIVLVGGSLLQLSDARSLPNVLAQWDGEFYLRIAGTGYPHPGEPLEAIAFFPLFPLMIRGVSEVIGASPQNTGIALAAVAGVAAAIAVWLFTVQVADARTALRTVALFSFFPSAYVLSMVYPDGAFIAAAAITLLALIRRRWLTAGISAAIATGLRPNGVVLVACCAWASFEDIRSTRAGRSLVAPLLAPLGAVTYGVFLWARMGSPSAYFDAQEQTWGMRFDFGMSNARMVLRLIDGPVGFNQLVSVAAMFTALVAVLLLIRWRPPTVVTIYSVGLVAIALLSTNTTSVIRFLMFAFPLLIPIAERPSHVRDPVLGVFAALMGMLFLLSGTMYLNP